MITFFEVFVCIASTVFFIMAIIWIIITVIDRESTQDRLQMSIRDGAREEVRSILHICSAKLTKDQIRNATIWLAEKDGMMK